MMNIHKSKSCKISNTISYFRRKTHTDIINHNSRGSIRTYLVVGACDWDLGQSNTLE
ncbi:hypothetical protein Hanom_Chr01g00061271 [Helianthus anomalus]